MPYKLDNLLAHGADLYTYVRNSWLNRIEGKLFSLRLDRLDLLTEMTDIINKRQQM